MTDDQPDQGLQLLSTIEPEGRLRLALARRPIVPPARDEAVVRLEAVPINPSDLMALLAAADPADGDFGGTDSRPEVIIPLTRGPMPAASACRWNPDSPARER